MDEVHGMLLEREEAFRAHGIDSIARPRTARAAGRPPELPCTDVVLVVDGFGSLRGDFEDLPELLEALLLRGGGCGIRVVAAIDRWNDVRIADRAAFGTRYELRLNAPGTPAPTVRSPPRCGCPTRARSPRPWPPPGPTCGCGRSVTARCSNSATSRAGRCCRWRPRSMCGCRAGPSGCSARARR
jgi:hypothetical protein